MEVFIRLPINREYSKASIFLNLNTQFLNIVNNIFVTFEPI